LLSDVERRKFPATRTCAATLDAIVRKKLDMSTQGIFTDRARKDCARRDSLGDGAGRDRDDRGNGD